MFATVQTVTRSAPAKHKHAEVVARVLELVERLGAGAALPPERELAVELGVARMTVRQAIGDVEALGLVRREQGRGTFVAGPRLAQPLAVTSFSQDARRRGLRPGSRVLGFHRGPGGAREARALALVEGEPVVTVTRLRLADDEPLAVETAHLPDTLLPGLRPEDLEDRSLYDLLAERAVVVATGTQAVEPTVLTAAEAALLDQEPGAAAFLFEVVTRDRDDRPVEFVRALYRGDRYRLVAELRPAPRPPGLATERLVPGAPHDLLLRPGLAEADP